jgi:glutamate transport system permease protein
MRDSLFYEGTGGSRFRIYLLNAVCLGVLVLVGFYVESRLNARGELDAIYWRVLLRHDLLSLFWSGLLATLKVAAVAMVLSMLFGIPLAAGRLSSNPLWRVPARAGVEILRGLPVLLLIFFVYLGLPFIGVNISAFWALVIGITLYNGALVGEVYRAGILALPSGQTEGSYSIGLTRVQSLRYVLMPQALRNMMPALVSQLVVILKESSLGFVVGYLELGRTASVAVAYLGEGYSLPIYFAIALIYIFLNSLLSLGARGLASQAGRRRSHVDIAAEDLTLVSEAS